MINLSIQIKTFAFSFLYGIFLNLIIDFIFLKIVKFKMLLRILFLNILVLLFSIIYFILLLCINNGVIHFYFLLFILLGYLFSLKLLKKIDLHINKKK